MTRIDGASGIAALIRAQALEQARLRQAQGQGEQARSAGGPAKEGSGDARVPAPLLRRLKGVDAADPDRRCKAFRMFMEATLVRELGEALQADPQFPALVDQVLQRMEDDPELQAASLEAADHLLEEAARWSEEGPDASPR
ncbi:hypothetical protein [Delftia tsuruhatensis]|uniref:hypothetical protein n=1 Tax=Delftia tsuruhatensis TaxID=180282 RepID=UPI0031E0F7AA